MKNYFLLVLFCCYVSIFSCKKSSDNNTNPCNGVTITVNGTPASVTSCTSANGSINANASGGTGPYEYKLDNGAFQSSSNFTGISAGSHTITAKDANGCTGAATVTVGSNTPTITVNGTPTSVTSCSSTNGSINANASGGTGPYEYKLDNGAFQSSSSFTGVSAGSHTITAKDANGCTGTATVAVGSNTPTITVNGTPASVTSCSSTNGSINANASGGTGPYEYKLDNGAFQSSSSFTGVSAGSHTITAKDANGCTGTATVAVGSNTPTITVNGTPASVTSCSSPNGSINANASGGTGPYTYQLDNGAFQSSPSFTGVSVGSHTITAKDANGCSGTTTVIVGSNTPTITVNGTPTSVTSCSSPNGSINANASGGTGPYEYRRDGLTFQTSSNFTGLSAGIYTITAKDANGCTGTSSSVVVSTAANGPLFTAVKNIITSRCSGCHTGGGSSGGVSFATDCGIVNRAARIQARAVTQGTMPPSGSIPNGEKQAINDWINAGGQFNQ